MNWLYGLLILFYATASLAGPKVLLINSYDPQQQWTQAIIQGIQQTLNPVVAGDDLYIEFMDSQRFSNDPTYSEALAQFYKHKYAHLTFNVIISIEDFALDFLIEHRDTIFPEAPVVYSAVHVDPTQKLSAFNDFVGILEGEAIAENLQLIAELHQDTINNIVVLSDKSAIGRLFSEKVLAIKNNWHYSNIEITLQDDFSFSELLYQVNNLEVKDNDSKHIGKAYFISKLSEDNQGHNISFFDDIPVLTRHSKAPIYGMWGAPLMGLGVVGGYMNDPILHGINTARIVRDILEGQEPATISRNTQAQYLPKFDSRQLKKFNIKVKDLPLMSEINFEQETLFSRFGYAIITITSIIIILAVIIVMLSIQVRRRKYAEKQLAQLNNELEDKITQRTLALERSNRTLLKLNSRMENLANTDDLTLIPNRRHGHRILDRLYFSKESGFSIALIDIDHFKRVNDLHGHDTGDQVLQFISHTINQFIRPSDTICRWGGEEFLLIMPNTRIDDAFNICERIRELIATTPADPVESITISIGISVNCNAKTINELLRQADLALYQAKTQGRNRCIIWSANSDQLKGTID